MNDLILKFSNYISQNIDINNEYVYLLLLTIITILSIKVIQEILKNILVRNDNDQQSRYRFNRHINIVCNVINFIIVFMIWDSHLKNLITIISFISAAVTIALKEIIVNYFSGIYIKIRKPFIIEDRIEISGYKGDVINTNLISFEILEISEDQYGEQSTGKIIHLPNSLIFTSPMKNYVKEFKYIWNEMIIKIPLNGDIKQAKNVIYKIINNNQTITSIPRKMKNQIDNINLEYRIYFSKFDPIIYTKIVDEHIELYVRFLMDPKKIRNVEDDISLKILEAYRKNEIMLYKS